MKLWTRGIALLASVAVFALALSASAATIVGSNHDMNAVFGPGTISNNEVCLPCHTPHAVPTDPVTGTQLGKLWNHTMPNRSYVLFGSGTSYASVAALPGSMDETSRKCLSCHDGTVAVDSYGSHTGTQKIGGTSATAGFLIGASGNLQHDHPVGVAYPKADATSGLWTSTSMRDPALWSGLTYYAADGTTVVTPVGNRGLSLKTVGTDKVVGCGTCHTPHDNTYRFLRISNARSQMCLTCHLK